MNDAATDLDQTDDEILTYTVSDEALEAAVRTEGGVVSFFCPMPAGSC